MKPPAWVCRALYRLDPSLRLGWMGRVPNSESEENPGSFVLVRLVPLSTSGTDEAPRILEEFWASALISPLSGWFTTVKVERGPIFGVNGRPRPDWDPLFFKPVILQAFNAEWGFSHEDVFSGYIVEHVRRQLATSKEHRRRLARQALQEGRDLESTVNDLGNTMGDEWYRNNNQVGATGQPLAWKHARQNLTKEFIDYKEGKYNFTDYHLKELGLTERDAQ